MEKGSTGAILPTVLFFTLLRIRERFIMQKGITTKQLVGIAVFSALSYAVSFLEFPIFPAAGFLKLDFSAVFTLLAGFIYGPIGGVAVCAVKELLCFLTKSSTGGVGEIANFIVTTGFILLPTIVYYFHKGFKTVVWTLSVACVIEVALALFTNRFINFPLFMGDGAVNAFNSLWWYVLLFNLIKSVAICVLTILLYKRVSIFIKAVSKPRVKKTTKEAAPIEEEPEQNCDAQTQCENQD